MADSLGEINQQTRKKLPANFSRAPRHKPDAWRRHDCFGGVIEFNPNVARAVLSDVGQS
jgi:hypothetical protein